MTLCGRNVSITTPQIAFRLGLIIEITGRTRDSWITLSLLLLFTNDCSVNNFVMYIKKNIYSYHEETYTYNK